MLRTVLTAVVTWLAWQGAKTLLAKDADTKSPAARPPQPERPEPLVIIERRR